jgi:N-sulfoglucosamine sulfohydrolase
MTTVAAAARPNIVYLHTHDTGRHIQPYGAPVPTPHLQRFAEEGVLFRRAHAAAPTCSPSRAALLTGQAPHSAGMLGLAHRGFGLTDPGQHLAHTLAAAGYHTAMVGQQHLNDPLDHATLGYAELLPSNGDRAADLLPGVLDFLGRDHDRPFFCSIGLSETHTMTDGGGRFGYPGEDDRYLAPPAPLPNTAQTRSDLASFRAAARIADDAYGQILAAIDESGLRERTLVVITTDHGLPLPGMKGTLTDAGTGVLLIIRGPGGFVGGRVCDALVSQVDLFPTICEVAGIERPDWLQGTSLLPAVVDSVEVNEAVFTESTHHVSYQPQRCVRTARFSLITDFSDWRRPRLANVDDSASKATWVAAGWADRPLPGERLHDLLLDPLELTNLVDDSAYAEVLVDLRRRLSEWMQRTADPLRHGPVASPPGFPPLPDDADLPVIR